MPILKELFSRGSSEDVLHNGARESKNEVKKLVASFFVRPESAVLKVREIVRWAARWSAFQSAINAIKEGHDPVEVANSMAMEGVRFKAPSDESDNIIEWIWQLEESKQAADIAVLLIEETQNG